MEFLKSIVYVAFIGILAHYVGEALPRRLFREDRFPFKLYKWERNGKVYEYIWIKKWKTKVPDMSRYMKDMLPKKVSFGSDSESVDMLIRETCVAEFIHKALCVFSLGVYFFWKNNIGIILALVCIICNVPFIIIQRCNRPHLIRLRNRLRRREEKKALCDI